jgi:hypothetical protein
VRMLMRLMMVTAVMTAAGAASGAELLRLRVAVHVDSSVSHTTRTTRVAGIAVRTQPGETPKGLAKIVAVAKQERIDAVILADRARAEVSYGLTPFSRLFKATVSQGSIESYGAEKYLDDVREAAAGSGTIVIPGAECMPYYRWTGGPLTSEPLRLKHAYEHMVVFGLTTSEQFENIPATAGGYGRRVTWTIFLNAFFLAMLVLGIGLWRKPGMRLDHGRVHAVRGRKILGVLLVIVAALALIDGAPFIEARVSPYAVPAKHPSEMLANYAHEHNALAFWAHPAAKPGSLSHRASQGGVVQVEVKPYPEAVLDTLAADGFAMFNAGVLPGLPNGHWDKALRAYCRGERPRPAWAISECDYDAESPPDGLSDAQTVVWARERSAEAIIEALREGRCYATKEDTHRRIEVRDYTLASDTVQVRSGATVTHAGESLRLNMTLAAPGDGLAKNLKTEVIVDGDVIGTLDFEREPDPTDGPAPAWREWKASMTLEPPRNKATYVRILVYDSNEAVLALNPIFIRRVAKD